MNAGSPFIALESQLGCLDTWLANRRRMTAAYDHASNVTDPDGYYKAMCGALYHAVPYYVASDIQHLLIEAARQIDNEEVLPDDIVPQDPMWIFLERGIPGRIKQPHPESTIIEPDGTKRCMIRQILVYRGRSADDPPRDGVMLVFAGTSAEQTDINQPSPYMSGFFQIDHDTVGRWRERSEGYTDGFNNGVSFLIALLRFINQKLLAVGNHPATRSESKRLERRQPTNDPVVRVIQLRAASTYRASGGDPQNRSYHCRWIVRGHWHPYWCGPGKARRELRWLLPHIAGPTDKPLKASTTTLFAVVR